MIVPLQYKKLKQKNKPVFCAIYPYANIMRAHSLLLYTAIIPRKSYAVVDDHCQSGRDLIQAAGSHPGTKKGREKIPPFLHVPSMLIDVSSFTGDTTAACLDTSFTIARALV